MSSNPVHLFSSLNIATRFNAAHDSSITKARALSLTKREYEFPTNEELEGLTTELAWGLSANPSAIQTEPKESN